MERLTVPDEPIEGGLRRAIIDVKAVKEQAMTIYWQLKKYEDTGLTPKEITSFVNNQRNFEVGASDNTDYTLTCKDGIYSVANKYGHVICEFIRQTEI